MKVSCQHCGKTYEIEAGGTLPTCTCGGTMPTKEMGTETVIRIFPEPRVHRQQTWGEWFFGV